MKIYELRKITIDGDLVIFSYNYRVPGDFRMGTGFHRYKLTPEQVQALVERLTKYKNPSQATWRKYEIRG